tara:strand:- start:338 stop:1177 length:840 start_codon:yes stop_codon:yes gene_type:complete
MDEQLETARNECLRRIGRNMVMFQRVEQLLKFLLANSSLEGYERDLESKQAKKASTISTMTMGQLSNEYFNSIFDTSEIELPPHEDPSQAYLSFKYSVQRSEEEIDAEKQYFADLVKERNELAHHLLPKYDPTSMQSIEELSESLEQQRERFFPALKNLTRLCEAHQKARQQMSDFFQSDECRKYIVEGILPGETRLDKLLRDAASFSTRDDGWSSLSLAGQFIKNQPEDIFEKVCEEQALSKLPALKTLIELSSIFELKSQPTKNGSIWLFRPKPLPH